MARGVPTEDVMVQSSLRLPRDLLERLKSLGDKSGLGMGGEIRQRIEASFEADDALEDAKAGRSKATAHVIDSVSYLAAVLKGYEIGSWTEDRFSYEVMRLCLNRLLEKRYKPKGELTIRSFKDGTMMEMLLGDKPQTAEAVANILFVNIINRLEAWPQKKGVV